MDNEFNREIDSELILNSRKNDEYLMNSGEKYWIQSEFAKKRVNSLFIRDSFFIVKLENW